MHVDPTHFLSDQHTVLCAECLLLRRCGFWANPVPSLDDQLRMLQQDPRVQPSVLRRRLSCVLVCSSRLLRSNTLSRCWRVLRKLPLATSRTSCAQQKYPFVNVETDSGCQHVETYLLRSRRIFMKQTRFSFHRLPIIKLLTPSTLFTRFRREWERFAAALAFHRTARSAIHGRLF